MTSPTGSPRRERTRTAVVVAERRRQRRLKHADATIEEELLGLSADLYGRGVRLASQVVVAALVFRQVCLGRTGPHSHLRPRDRPGELRRLRHVRTE